MKKVAIIHTSAVSLNDLKALFAELCPNVEVINIIDDSLLEEVKRNIGVTPAVQTRMCMYVHIAETLGVDLIFNQCSSVGEAFDVATRMVKVKTLKVDKPMAQKAVSLGSKIGLVATVESTVRPSVNNVLNTAKEMGKHVEVKEYLVKNALDILMKEKNLEKHNQLVLAEIKKAASENDVVVLAQGSMTTMLPYLKDIDKPVLTSPRLGVERAKEMLGE